MHRQTVSSVSFDKTLSWFAYNCIFCVLINLDQFNEKVKTRTHHVWNTRSRRNTFQTPLIESQYIAAASSKSFLSFRMKLNSIYYCLGKWRPWSKSLQLSWNWIRFKCGSFTDFSRCADKNIILTISIFCNSLHRFRGRTLDFTMIAELYLYSIEFEFVWPSSHFTHSLSPR